MVEVFKTNVNEPFHAEILLRLIHISFNEYSASFDLEDRDKVLRVESKIIVKTEDLVNMLLNLGFEIEILSNDVPSDYTSNIDLRKTA